MSDNDPSAADPFGQIADEFVEAFRQGLSPSVEEFARRYPEHADEIRDMLPALVLVEKAKAPDDTSGEARGRTSTAVTPLRQLGDYQILREVGRGGMGVVYEAQQLSLGRHVAIKVLPSHSLLDRRHLARFQREARSAARLHHTNIVPVFGVGEQDGLHYYVMQFIPGLGLDVVLDELRRLRQPCGQEALTQGDARGRPTNVTHNASAVHVARGLLSGEFRLPQQTGDFTAAPPEAGPLVSAPAGDSGSSTQVRAADSSATVRLPGQSETSTLSESGGQYWQSVARVGMQVADALAHASRQGVLHRDIKPSNLLLDDTGNVWVTDFGLAKADDSDNITNTGDIVGTLRYMAPERFNGAGDVRGDVYSLGLTLYELLTLRPAFDETDRNRVVKQVMHDEPMRPRKVNSAVPRDLETVVLKAIARDAAHRYQTPAEMAEDLKRFVEDRPVKARRIGDAERLWRWCRRNPLPASLVAGMVLVFLVGFAGVFWQWLEATAAREDEKRQRGRAEALRQGAELARDEARQNASRAEQSQKETAAQKAEVERSLAKAETAEEAGRKLLYTTDMRLAPFLWRDDRTTAEQLRTLLAKHIPNRQAADTRPDLRGFEYYYYRHLLEHSATVFSAGEDALVGGAFGPDGELVTLHQSGQVRRWDLESQNEDKARRKELGRKVPTGVLSPDGRLAALAEGKQATVFSTLTGKEIFHIDSADTPSRRLLFTPDSARLVIVDNKVRWCDAGNGRVIASVNQDFSRASSLALSADGLTLAVVGHGYLGNLFSTFRLDATTQKVIPQARDVGPSGSLSAAALSPDGRLIAVGASLSGYLLVYDATTGRPVAQHGSAHASPVSALAFAANGRELVTADLQGTMKVWEDARKMTSKGAALRTLKGHEAAITQVTFSPTGKQLVSISADKTARVWDMDHAGASIRLLERSGTGCYVARFSPDGQLIAAPNGPGVALWDAGTGKLVRQFSPGASSPLPLSPSEGERGRGEEARGRVSSVAFSPTDPRLLAMGFGGPAGVSHVELWDLDTGRVLARLTGATDLPDFRATDEYSGVVGALAFSPDGKYLVAGFGSPNVLFNAVAPNPLKVWEVATRRLIRRLGGHTGYCVSLDFSRDGKRLASGSRDGTAIVWSTDSWKATHTLRNPDPATIFGQGGRGMVEAVAFAPDGETLAMASREGSVLLWGVADGELRATLKGHSSAVSAAAFSPDGRTLATGGFDHTVRLWNVATRRELMQLDPGNVELGVVETLAFWPDGQRLLAGGRSGIAYWSTAPSVWADLDQAAEKLRRLLPANANLPGRIRLFSENLRLHEALAKLDPQDSCVQAALAATRANWHAAHGRWAEAAREYDRLEKLRPGEFASWLRTPGLIRVATALFHEGRAARAATLLTGGRIRRSQDGVPSIATTIVLGGYLIDPATGEWWRPLLGAINARLRTDPRNAGLLELRAELAGQWADSRAQVADYTTAIETLTRQPAEAAAAALKRLYGRRGNAYVRLGKWPEAAADLARAITPATTDDELLTNQARALAGVLLQSHKAPAALTIVDPWARLAAAYRLGGDQQAIDELVKHRPSAAGRIGDLFAADRDWSRAVAIYSRGITADTTDIPLLSRRARAYEALQNWDAAAADWSRAATGNPEGAELLADFARRLAVRDQLPLAHRHFEMAQALDEQLLNADPHNDLVARDLMQLLFDRQGKRAVVGDGTDPWLGLGAAYAVSGRREEASRYFGRAFPAADGSDAGSPTMPAGLSDMLQGAVLDDAAKARLRGLALDAIRAELALRRKQLESDRPAERALVAAALLGWQTDANLAGVRDTPALATLPADERTAFTQFWAEATELSFQAITATPAEKQVVLVADWLKECNPGFDGKVTPRIENRVVTGLDMPSPLVQDLTPLRALTGLRTLICRSTLAYDNRAESDAAVLRSLQTLKTINGKPVAQFWKDAQARQAELKGWLERVRALPVGQQGNAVLAKLKERNPGSPCKLTVKTEGNVVTDIWIHEADLLTDLSPVRALGGLKSFRMDGGSGGYLTDLSPLEDLKNLTHVSVNQMKVRDLSPLRGMKLTSLDLAGCKELHDLSPLRGMKLTSLNLHTCAGIRDLTPLSGMPLTFLNLHDGPKVADLSPLRGMKLTELWLGGNRVRDLSPLRGMPLTMLALSHCPLVEDLSPLRGIPLTTLYVDDTRVRDLEPLRGMRLKNLYIYAPRVADVTPLQGMQLESIRLTAKNITRGIEILRAMKSLKTIGPDHYKAWPAAEFWARYDRGELEK
jgi:WD40 repeat protein/serine/threonine protein kinase/tetratricopeptide (TPR) repeat protein